MLGELAATYDICGLTKTIQVHVYCHIGI